MTEPTENTHARRAFKGNRDVALLIGVVIICAALARLSAVDIAGPWDPGDWSFSSSERVDTRRRAAALLKDIKVGSTSAQVSAALKVHGWPQHLLREWENQVTVNTPNEIGAHNWVIEIEFRNNTVISIRVGTMDSASHLPYDYKDY